MDIESELLHQMSTLQQTKHFPECLESTSDIKISLGNFALLLISQPIISYLIDLELGIGSEVLYIWYSTLTLR
jgi:hypothetical protein